MQNRMNLDAVERILSSALAGAPSASRARLLSHRWSDSGDEAQWSEDAAVAIRELDVDWATKRQARQALDRLRTGRYGVCDACGKAIGPARLTALPWATQCVRCAALREHADRQRNHESAALPGELLDQSPDAA